MPQEHTGQAGFDYAWKELMTHSETAGTQVHPFAQESRSDASSPFSDSLISCDTDVFDETIFKLVWRSVVHAIANAFTTFDDELVVQDVIAGFRQCATLAGKYQLPEVFDFLVSSLSRATGLLRGANAPATANFPVVEVDGQNVTVSPLSIKLGTSFRGQLAAVVLFTIANGNGNAIRDGWAQVRTTPSRSRKSLDLIDFLNRSLRCSKLSSYTLFSLLGCFNLKTSLVACL